jgi:hypothetical protein
VEIGDFTQMSAPEIKSYEGPPDALLLEKKLIITDNENFSVRSACNNITGAPVELEKTVLFEISGAKLNRSAILESGLILNQSKEFLVETKTESPQYGVLEHDDDYADHLAEKLSELLRTKVRVRMFKCWDFGKTDPSLVEAVLQNRLLANPNSAALYRM